MFCPKCGGQMFEEKTHVGTEYGCLQCGYRIYQKPRITKTLVVKK